MKKSEKFETVGSITVDAGLVRVGDPCYSFKNQNKWLAWLTKHLEFGKTNNRKDTYAVAHDSRSGNYGEHAAAIVVTSGMGDGVYPVQVKRCSETGLIRELRVKFF